MIEKTLTFREHFGDYQRQLFLVDHAGLPLKTVLEQLDLLGEQVVPVLRRELDALRPADVPEAPTHASLLAANAVRARARGERVVTLRQAQGPARIVVITAGLRQPSSSRLLADRLAAMAA